MLSIPRLSPRRLSMMFFQLSILSAIASNVSGSSARMNSKRLFGEHTPATFRSNRLIGAARRLSGDQMRSATYSAAHDGVDGGCNAAASCLT